MGKSHFGNRYQIGQSLVTIVKRMRDHILQSMQEFNPDDDVICKDDLEGGSGTDITTLIDANAQKMCIEIAQRTWGAELGIIAEESPEGVSYFRASAFDDCEAYMTIDPLDGTRAFVNGGSVAVGIILAMIVDGETVGSVICNIATGEIYLQGHNGYPYHKTFYRSQLGMRIDRKYSYEDFCQTHCIAQQNLTSRGYNNCICAFLRDSRLDQPGLFKRAEVGSGSTALTFARLWKGEVTSTVLPGSRTDTPWDMNAIFAINQQVSMDVRRFSVSDNGFCELEQKPILHPMQREQPHLYMPSVHVPHMKRWARDNGYSWEQF